MLRLICEQVNLNDKFSIGAPTSSSASMFERADGDVGAPVRNYLSVRKMDYSPK